MLWDEPKIFFLERRYFFSIILSEFLKNRVALQESTAPAVPTQPKSDRAASTAPEDPGSADSAASKDTAPPVGEMTPTHSQPSGQAGQTAPAGADYRAPAVGETVVRMLHHMSGIFEDNSKIDQIHRGLQTDRKRRQELRRKRLAMGHKPDDHEEQTFR